MYFLSSSMNSSSFSIMLAQKSILFSIFLIPTEATLSCLGCAALSSFWSSAYLNHHPLLQGWYRITLLSLCSPITSKMHRTFREKTRTNQNRFTTASFAFKPFQSIIYEITPQPFPPHDPSLFYLFILLGVVKYLLFILLVCQILALFLLEFLLFLLRNLFFIHVVHMFDAISTKPLIRRNRMERWIQTENMKSIVASITQQ